MWVFPALLLSAGMIAPRALHAAVGGSISGTVTDPRGAVVPNATLNLVDTGQQTRYQVTTDNQGTYSFPNLPVGHYELTISAAGFTSQRKTNLIVDADASLRVDVPLQLGTRAEVVTVSTDDAVAVETSATHLGEVVSAAEMTALPLNGRSYTDLLAIQPGVAPISTLLPNSVIMAGVTGSLDPSGDLNPGNLSINGQRESSNGFLRCSRDVRHHRQRHPA